MMKEVINYLRGVPGESGFGSRSTAEDVTQNLPLPYLTAVVTGATSGIGAETARVLAKRGIQIVVAARNVKAGEALKHSIRKEVPDARIIVLQMDLSSLSSVRSFAEQFLNLRLPLNILINNAGVVCRRFRLSEDGYEMDFATNHLGHFYLTKLLLDKMIETAKCSGVEGRIVNVSSSLHRWAANRRIEFKKINDQASFVESLNYAQSKLANILHAKELARRLKEMGGYVTANSLHPGLVRTNITRDRMGLVTDVIFILASAFMKSIPQGASTICYVATHPNVNGVSGKYFVDCNEATCSPCANDERLAFDLWERSEKMINSHRMRFEKWQRLELS